MARRLSAGIDQSQTVSKLYNQLLQKLTSCWLEREQYTRM